MGRAVAIEFAWLIAAVGLALLCTWGAAWAYPLGHDAIWTVGGATMLALVLINLRPLREARRRDRAQRSSA